MGKYTADKAEMYRRQLGGTNAALNRARQRNRELEELCRDLFFFVAPQYRYAPISKDFENRMNALGLLEVPND